MRFECLRLGCSQRPGSSSGFRAVISIFFIFSFFPAEPPAQCQASVREKTPLSEAQGCHFFIVVQFRPADALLSPEPGGDQNTLFARNVVQGYVRACVSSFFFCVSCICSTLFFSAIHFLPSRYCRCCHLPSRVFVVSSSNPLPCRWPAGGFWYDFSLVLAPVSPPYRREFASTWCLFCGWFAEEPFLPPPRHTGGMRRF